VIRIRRPAAAYARQMAEVRSVEALSQMICSKSVNV
jgi:hypothetical protein